MPQNSLRYSILGAASALASTYVSLMLAGLGLPLLVAALLAAVCAGLVLLTAGPASSPPPDRSAEDALRRTLDVYVTEVASLRHDLRGVLSPALMMTDRLLKHADPSVQRAGSAVVRSIERATALLASNKAAVASPPLTPPPGAGQSLERFGDSDAV